MKLLLVRLVLKLFQLDLKLTLVGTCRLLIKWGIDLEQETYRDNFGNLNIKIRIIRLYHST